MLMRYSSILVFYRSSAVSILVSFENNIASLSDAVFILHGRCTNYYIDAIVVVLAINQNLLEAILQISQFVFDRS